jgi:hypothetical protein
MTWFVFRAVARAMGVLLASAGLLAAGCSDVGAHDDDEPLATVRQAVAGDPTSVHPYFACGPVIRTWESTELRIYHPSSPSGGCSDGTVYAPLVILLHGVTYGHDEYDTILHHLARNGMIAVSINWGSDPVARARDVMDEFLFNEWDYAPFIDPTRVGLIGHSRGTEHAAALAADLAEGPDPGGPTWTVRAIADLAPVAHTAVDGNITTGYLLLHGTADGDQIPARSFEHFEAAGPPGSQGDPPPLDPEIVYKAMKLFEAGTHAGFTGSTDQAHVAKGYLSAFFAAHLQSNPTWYEDYIRGHQVPFGWGDGEIWSQHSDGFLRRVIDRFDDGNLSPSSIGGTVTANLVTTTVSDLALSASSPHTTPVLSMMATSTSGYVEWTIPSGKRNASAFEFLSMRLGQVSGTPGNDLTVQIRNGATWSAEIVAAAYDPIAQPSDMCTVSTGMSGAFCAVGGVDEQYHMSTIRVPLAALGAHDDVERVRLRFRGDSMLKRYYLDNLELSESPLKP